MAEDAGKPAVLIIGGLGFLGRYLARYIHENNLASEIRLVDKLLPQLAWLAPEFQEACSQDKFVQADASREQSFPRVFDRTDGSQFDYVFNCGGESRFSQPEDLYRLRGHALSVALGKECARRGISAFVECSSALVYKGDRKPRKETDTAKPEFDLAKWKLVADEDLQKIPGLNLTILRFAHVYGDYDAGFLAPVICTARVYKDLERELPLLFPRDQTLNTVHVEDAVRALWTAAAWRSKQTADQSSLPIVFNIVDHNKTTVGDLTDATSRTLGTKISFVNALLAKLATLTPDEVFAEANEGSLEVWSDLLDEKGITRPGPIGPYLENDHFKGAELSVDGSRFEQTTGFKYQRETVPPDWIEAMIKSYERMNWWP